MVPLKDHVTLALWHYDTRGGEDMEKITMKDFEELISKDEALTAKAKEITGEGEAR